MDTVLPFALAIMLGSLGADLVRLLARKWAHDRRLRRVYVGGRAAGRNSGIAQAWADRFQ